jgi:HSP20 family molecular chaperone IbpA
MINIRRKANKYDLLNRDLFDNMFYFSTGSAVPKVEIPVEVFEKENNYECYFYLCNVDKKDIDISIENGNVLCINFVRAPPETPPLLSSLQYGAISTKVKLNCSYFTQEAVNAKLNNNILQVTISKDHLSSKIEIK